MTENARSYPYKAWTVMPSGKPVEVEIVKLSSSWGSDERWVRDSADKGYDAHKLQPSKEAAIAAELAKLDEQQAKIAKQLNKMDKKRATLEKARTT